MCTYKVINIQKNLYMSKNKTMILISALLCLGTYFRKSLLPSTSSTCFCHTSVLKKKH